MDESAENTPRSQSVFMRGVKGGPFIFAQIGECIMRIHSESGEAWVLRWKDGRIGAYEWWPTQVRRD